MKNIYEILADYGIAVEEEHRADFEKQLFASYKSAGEMEKKDAKVAQLEEALAQRDQLHAKELAERDFSRMLDAAILGAKGRNPRAITALLDLEMLKSAEKPEKAITDAIAELRKSDSYLFEQTKLPPLYARGTGAETGAHSTAPATLAGALQERFMKERK